MKIKIRLPSMSLDWLLVATIAGLLVVLCWPAVEAWENRPRPGVQVCQQYVGQGGSGPNAVIAHVDYLLYLPPEYEGSHKWPLVVFLARFRGTRTRLTTCATGGTTPAD